MIGISSFFTALWAWEAETEQTVDFMNTLLGIFSTQVLLRIIFAIITIIITFALAKLAKNRLFAYLENGPMAWETGKEELIWVISRSVNIAILAVWFSITLGVLGIDLTQWVYHVGDLIEINGKKGKIAKINSLFTDVEQFDGVFFYIPNIKFLENEVSNYHTNDKRRVEVEVLVDYDSDIVKAKAIINKVLENFPILQAPASDIIVDTLWDNGILLKVRFWIGSKDSYFTMKSNITETINLGFKQSGIVIPFPQITLGNRK